MRPSIIIRQAFILVLGIALVAITISSCKKEDTGENGYFIRFKANGTVVNYTIQASLVAAFGKSGIQHNAVFSGGDASSNISLQVFDSKSIVASAFSGYTITDGAVVGALIGYSDNTGTLYTQGSVGSNASITITGITATTVSGTFSGTLKASGKADIVVSQGEFFVWRAN